MAIINEVYEIDLEFEGVPLELDSSAFSMTIQDSIYSVYPKMNLTINDFSGILQEYIFGVEGSKLDVYYGYVDGDSIECPFTFTSDENKSVANNTKITGSVSYNLVHRFYSKQSKVSTAYKDRISNIVRSISETFDFEKVNINDTGNQDIWYQPLITDTELIESIFLKYASSNNSNESPFYFFIDSKNNFNFVNYHYMMNSNFSSPEITYGFPNKEGDPTRIANTVKRMSLGSDITKKYRSVRNFMINKEGKPVEEDSSYYTSYPNNLNGKIPIMYDDSNVTDYEVLREDYTKANIQNNKGRKINKYRKVLGLNKLLVGLPYNPSLTAGKSIDFTTLSASSTEYEKSILFSDRYLIEETNHIWDGSQNTGASIIVISRKNIKVPESEYILYRKLGG